MTSAQGAAAAAPVAAADAPAWHAMTPRRCSRPRASRRTAGSPTPRSTRGAPSSARTSSPRRPRSPRWQSFLRQYPDPMQIVLLGAGILSLFLPGQFATGVVLVVLTLLQRLPGPEPGGQGRGERRRAPEDDGRPGEGPPRRRGRQVADGGARPRRHRHRRGGRPGPRGRPDHPRGHPRDRRVGADRRERARCPSRSRPSRPTPALGDRVDLAFMNTQVTRGAATLVVTSTGHGHRGRPHLATCCRRRRRGDAADQAAQRADQPDPRHRRRRAGRSRSASACAAARRSRRCS